MPKIDGFEYSAKIFKLDANIRICFMSSGLINQKALRRLYPTLSTGCFIKKPLEIKDLVRRLKAELE
jgi:response regulator RpfG family c-di-GMP phosphodiesterase